MCTPELGSRPSHLPGEGPRGEVPWNGPGGGLSQEFGSPRYTSIQGVDLGVVFFFGCGRAPTLMLSKAWGLQVGALLV